MLGFVQDQQYDRKQRHVPRHHGTMVASAFATWSIDPMTRITWLGVGVHPARQRRAIGTSMFDRMEALARDADAGVVR